MTGPARCAKRTMAAVPARACHAHRSEATAADEGGIEEVMRTGVVCVRAEAGIPVLRHLLLERRVGGVPVVNTDGRPVGIVSGGDLLRSLLQGGTPPTTAREIMSTEVLALPITASIDRKSVV